MINQKIVAQMTYSEQVELTRLEDECIQAKDSYEFSQVDWNELENADHLSELIICERALEICTNNLNKYINCMTEKYRHMVVLLEMDKYTIV